MSFSQYDIATGAGTWFDYPECIGFSRQPFMSISVGPWQCVAGPNGCAVGCFGWVNPEIGQVSNAQSAGAFLVFVLPHANPYNLWERVYFQLPQQMLPPGYQPPLQPPPPNSPPAPLFAQEIVRPGVRLCAAISGTFSPKFPSGGTVGTQVFADPATGLPYAGNITGSLVATPYTLMQTGGPNRRLRMTAFAKPFAQQAA